MTRAAQHHTECRPRTQDEDGVQVHHGPAPFRSGDTQLAKALTEELLDESRPKYLTCRDPLTGLCNRHYVLSQLDTLAADAQMPLSVIVADVDDLKPINDEFGWEEGDRLLQVVARVLKSTCGESAIVARWGGDEFIALLPATDYPASAELCRRIAHACDLEPSNPAKPSITTGFACRSTSTQDMVSVICEAEDAMHKSKLRHLTGHRGGLLASLLRALDESTHETDEHSTRMQYHAASVGAAIGLPHSGVDDLMLLCSLHDIGKIAVPGSILTKPGPLTSEEWAIVKRHPEIGFRIVSRCRGLGAVARAILAHHERWDGSGYPNGLRGEEIPLMSRLLAIVDAYDAMVNGRPYKPPVTSTEAIEELRSCAGTQFDPNLVGLFIEAL